MLLKKRERGPTIEAEWLAPSESSDASQTRAHFFTLHIYYGQIGLRSMSIFFKQGKGLLNLLQQRAFSDN